MRIEIRLGAGLAQRAGGSRLAVEVPEGASVADVLMELSARSPALGDLGSVLTVVRGRHAGRDQRLRPGDELSLLMPAAGG